jgi:hypothetical protein
MATTIPNASDGFSISKRTGTSWPIEVYDITPTYINKNATALPKGGVSYKAQNIIRYLNNPNTDNNKILNEYKFADYRYGNLKYFIYEPTISNTSSLTSDTTYYYVLSSYLKTPSTLSYIPSSLRLIDSGDFFNFLSFEYKSTINSITSFSYLLIPESLFNYPIDAYVDGNNYILRTKTLLLSSNFVRFFGNFSQNNAYRTLNNYLYTKPLTSNIPSNPGSNIYTSISAYKNVKDKKIIDLNLNASNSVVFLEDYIDNSNKNFIIRPDSTFLTYKSLYNSGTSRGIIGQDLPELYYGVPIDFKGSLILTQNLNDKYFQTFQLAQSSVFKNLKLDELSNTIESITIDLTSSNISHELFTYDLDEFGTNLSLVSPINPIGVSYKIDSNYFLGDPSVNLYSDISTLSSEDLLVHTLNNPPHYYTIKSSYISSNFPKYGATTNLNFNLSTGISKYYYSGGDSISGVEISSFLFSNFNILKLDFPTFCKNDNIIFYSYLIRNSVGEVVESAYLSALECFYGNNLNVYYDLNNPIYIPAVSASKILIRYPKEIYGEFDLFLFSSLSCNNLTEIDNENILRINFSKGKTVTLYEYPIYIEKIRELQNRMDLSCSKLSSDSLFSTKDLTNTFISWSYYPESENIKMVAIDRNTLTQYQSSNYSNYEIKNGEPILFLDNTSTICISGYGIDSITVVLSSQKYNETATIKNVLYDYFYLNDSELKINSSDVLRTNNVANLYLIANRYYHGTILPIPSSADLYWNFDYYNKNLVEIYYNNGTIKYKENDLIDSYLLSSIQVKINPDYNDLSSQIQPFKINLNLLTGSDKTLSTSYSTNIFLLPTDDIANVDFEIKANGIQNLENKIYKTRNKTNLITRPNDDLNSFTFKGNTDIIPLLSYDSLTWIVSTDVNYSYTTSYNFNQDLIVNFYDIYQQFSNIKKATVTLSAYKAKLPNWLISRNLNSNFTLNLLPKTFLDQKLQFKIYSPYTWLSASSGFITLLNDSNYDVLSFSPTAYANKKSLSQNFYVSANRNYDSYEYYSGSNLLYLNTLTSTKAQIEIPYSNELYSDLGAVVYLSAFKENLFPKHDGISYTGVTPNNTEYTGYFPVFSNTLPYSSTYIKTTSAFLQSPKIIEYNSNTISFYVNSTSIDLDKNIFLNVTQNISGLNIHNPAKISNDRFTQSITYILSCKYWKTDVSIPAINGTYDLFILRIGDPSEPLNIKDLEITTLSLQASSNIDLKIPKTTFQYVSSNFTGDIDLWNDKSVPILTNPLTIFAYSTSVKPNIFTSSYYTITGKEIYFEFETPENSLNYRISSYDLFFGDGLSAKLLDNSKIYKSYYKDDTYYVSFIANYTNGNSTYFEMSNPILVFSEWPYYDQSKIRLLSENQLYFGNVNENTYNLDQIEIQPNEWGDVDIFNTGIYRLYSNLQYLKDNCRTLISNSPEVYYGWLGTNLDKKSDGISWHTKDYKKFYFNYPNKATSSGSNYFSYLKDAVENKDRFFVIDETTIRAFSSSKIPQEIVFENKEAIDDLLVNPVSIDIDDSGENIYVADNFKNKIYKLNLDFDFYPPQINVQLNVGNFGKREEPSKLNSPTEIIYKKETLFVLDYNNKCIKQYTKDLNWMFTYYTEDFETYQPMTIAVHPEDLFVYVLTENYKIYIFDYFSSDVFEIIDISDIDKNYTPLKLFFDDGGDFIYILTEKELYKYSTSGLYITNTTLPNLESLSLVTGKSSFYRSILILTRNSIIKFSDIIFYQEIGKGLPYSYWTEEQIKLNRDDLALDLNYNTSLIRLCQNIKQFRDNLNSRFVIVSEKENFGTIEYYSIYPISNKIKLIFSDDIENENIGVGVNEFHIPQVLNREFKKIYIALEQLRDYLEIIDVRLIDGNSGLSDICTGTFCWSWKGMSSYDLKFPVLKVCNINPITYSELSSDFSSEYSYAPSKTFGEASSDCCNSLKPPI